MPFANYDSWEDCVSSNSGKDDPEAYCASIKREVEGEAALSTAEQALLRDSPYEGRNVLADVEADDDDPCWDGYTMVGTKQENGQTVPRCVPEEDVPDDVMAEVQSEVEHRLETAAA